jgi:hypothetical protein
VPGPQAALRGALSEAPAQASTFRDQFNVKVRLASICKDEALREQIEMVGAAFAQLLSESWTLTTLGITNSFSASLESSRLKQLDVTDGNDQKFFETVLRLVSGSSTENMEYSGLKRTFNTLYKPIRSRNWTAGL